MIPINLEQTIPLNITTSSVNIGSINYDIISGNWTIQVSFIISKPSRNTSNDVSTLIFENYNVNARTIITGAEIAKEANLAEGVAASTLSGQDLQANILIIATRKVLAALS